MSSEEPKVTLWKPRLAPFTKEVISKGYGFNTPQDGSVCKIKIISDEAQLLKDLNDETKELVVGDVDETIDGVIEECVRSMKEEEICQIKFQYPFLSTTELHLKESKDASSRGKNGLENELEKENLNESQKENINESEKENINESEKENINESEKENINESEKENTAEVDSKNESRNQNTNETEKENKTDSEGGNNSEQENLACPEMSSTGNTNLSPNVEAMEIDSCDVVSNEDEMKPSKEYIIKIQLLSYTREPEIWEMSVTEKWRRANYHKQKGLELYARGAYQYAFRRFGLTLKYVISLEHDVPVGQEEGMDINGLKLSCYLNVAACQMRHHSFEFVVTNSTRALLMQPNSAKALYRRGAALVQLQEYERAKEDLAKAQELEPKNQAIQKQQQILKARVQKLNQYYATAMKKMFS